MEAFKKAIVDWVGEICHDLFSTSVMGKFAKPIVIEIVEKNINHPMVEIVFNTFVKDGKFEIDSLLDKYKAEFSGEGLKFKWKDIHPSLAILGEHDNIIDKEDFANLKKIHEHHKSQMGYTRR